MRVGETGATRARGAERGSADGVKAAVLRPELDSVWSHGSAVQVKKDLSFADKQKFTGSTRRVEIDSQIWFSEQPRSESGIAGGRTTKEVGHRQEKVPAIQLQSA